MGLLPTSVQVVIGLVAVLLVVLLAKSWVARLFGLVIVPEDSIGIVNKRFVLNNRTLPAGSIVALRGEAGVQADTLAPGLHKGYWPWQYSITLQKFLTIPQDKIGIVEARDGQSLADGRVLARHVDCDSFQNARAFLEGNGQRGPQLSIITPGTWRINTAIFSVRLADAVDIPDNQVGIVTTKDGRPLPTGDIAGREVPGHDAYQNGQAFMDSGGYKGLQEQPLLAGRYFLNPMFVSVELKDMTTVPIANVGVVISYVGEPGVDQTGEGFKHGNLVPKGKKGVWVDPLDPGKYPVNPFTHKVELVPTANVVLNWATGKTESHNLDKNLSTITVRSSDGYTFNLDVSQILHIPSPDAPKVIARFGTMVNLVSQVLEPIIGNYFRNSAQTSDVIDFLKTRKERQDDARQKIAEALAVYNVVAVDTLIGDITPPPDLMKTLTDRKLAEQQKRTFEVQKAAQVERKELQQATAMAETQPSVVQAERSVQIAEFNAQAAVKTATGAAQAKTLQADADAHVTTVTGAAEADKTLKIGTAEADVIKQKIVSMEAGNYASIEVARALAQSGQRLVPEIVAGGSMGGDSNAGLIGLLMATMLDERVNGKANGEVKPVKTITASKSPKE